MTTILDDLLEMTSRLRQTPPRPAFEVYSRENEVEVRILAPGIDKTTIDVQIKSHEISFTGTRKKGEESPIYSEVYYGRTIVTIPFEFNLDVNSGSISYQDGILSIKANKTNNQSRSLKLE